MEDSLLLTGNSLLLTVYSLLLTVHSLLLTGNSITAVSMMARKRLRRFTREIWLWCKEHLHWRIWGKYDMLCSKLWERSNYYGIRSNYMDAKILNTEEPYEGNLHLQVSGGSGE